MDTKETLTRTVSENTIRNLYNLLADIKAREPETWARIRQRAEELRAGKQ